MSGCAILDSGIAARQNGKRLPCERLMDENAKLRYDLEEANNQAEEVCIENAKLRELVSGLEHCTQGFACDCCPLYDPSGTNHHRCESLERELGVEVTDG